MDLLDKEVDARNERLGEQELRVSETETALRERLDELTRLTVEMEGLRAGRHFREADTAEDVALSLKALAPFYSNSADGIRLAARIELGDAVLVKNVLSRFSHRDASKHGAEVNTAEVSGLVKEAAEAPKITGQVVGK